MRPTIRFEDLRSYTVLFAALLLLVSATGCGPDETTEGGAGRVDQEEMAQGQKKYTPSEEARASEEDLEVFDIVDAVDQNGNRYIVGKVRSKSQKPYTYVEINFTLHDDSQNTLGRATANTTSLRAGDVWEFQTEVSLKEVSQYRLERTFGW